MHRKRGFKKRGKRGGKKHRKALKRGTFKAKVLKVMRKLGPANFFDVAFASANMAAWSTATLTLG